MIYGYIRVSDQDQNEARQIESMIKQGINDTELFIDKASGKDFNRTEYKKLIKVLKPGDLLILHSIDRLGRNYKEIMAEWQHITTDLKVDIKVLDMPLLDTTLHKDLLGTFISDLVLQVLAFVAEQERQNIKKRQAEGIAIAKKEGKYRGRKPVEYPKQWDKYYKQWKEGIITATDMMKILDLKRTTFYKLNKSYIEQSN